MNKFYSIQKTFIVSCIVLLFAYLNITYLFTFFTKNIFANIAYGEIITTQTIEKLPEPEVLFNKTQISFVGDVMLARHVEHLMKKNGLDYPYKLFNFPDKDSTFLVGNFEASIPIKHIKTPNYNFNFSADEKYIVNLDDVGFTHFSLANNHSYDFGMEGYLNAKTALKNQNLISFGDPNVFSTSSIEFLQLTNLHVAIIGVNLVDKTINFDQVSNVLEYANENSDMQIIYIHWGDEYKLAQSDTQRKFATMFVEAGADLIIGHHPHVTQGIEKIDNALVFYSLGNFIFDQYFSTSVREGLMVSVLSNSTTTIDVRISGITNMYGLAQPKLMSSIEQDIFMQSIVERSSDSIKNDIMSGKFILNIPLATSSETVIMTE